MRVPMILGSKLPEKAKTFTLSQVLSVIGHVCQVQKEDGEVQLSILARALCISAKAAGIGEAAFFKELRSVWAMADANDLKHTQMPTQGPVSPIVRPSEADVKALDMHQVGLRPSKVN